MSGVRILVLWCPDWPLVAAGADPAAAAAVMASGRVNACTAAARALGVRRGQRLRDAQRYCPDLLVLPADDAGQARAFEPVVATIEEICPRVEVVRPGLVAVPARGPARYYGDEQLVAAAVRDAVLARGVACAIGVGEGMFVATLAARAAWADGAAGGDGIRLVASPDTAEFLAPHPVTAVELPELAAVLVRLGIRTLGDLAALAPRDVLVRFGPDGELAHRLASGLAARLPATRGPGEDLAAEVEFDPPAEQSEQAVFAAKSLADQLHANLAARGLVCARLEVEAGTSDGRTRARLWRHDGLLSSLAVAERVRWQLDAWRTAGELGGALTHLRLAPDHLDVDTGRQSGLWGQEPVSQEVSRAATRIQTMLGHTAIGTPAIVGGRGPGEQVVLVPWGDVVDLPRPIGHPWPARILSPAPSVMLPRPRAAAVLDADRQPVQVSDRSALSAPPAWLRPEDEQAALPVTAWTRPWPVRERWWRPEGGLRRARFQLVTGDGRAWLVHVQAQQWYIEAIYA